MKLVRFAMVAAVCTALSAAAWANDQEEKETPLIEPWGYPLAALDRETRPGDDFYRFANGGWLDATDIPSDRAGYGFSTIMRDRNEQRIAHIIEQLKDLRVRRGSDPQRIRDLYASFLDTERIEARGLEPVSEDLVRIAEANSHEDIAALMADPELGIGGPFSVYVWVDSKQPDRFVTWLTHSGLGLPDKSYYERETERMEATREAYRTHIAAMLELAEVENAKQKADAVFELEKAIAALHWERAERRDADRTYNKMTIAELRELAPAFSWDAYFDGAGLGEARDFVVREKDAFPELASLFAQTDIETWRAYLTYHLLRSFASYLPARFDEENFAFFGKTLNGQSEQRPREKRGIALVNDLLDQAVGKLYIERFFPEESKIQMTALFENVRAALRNRIANLSWMTPETKVRAQEKLEMMTAKIAYPDKWRSYAGLRIRARDLIGNVKRVRSLDAKRDQQRLSSPVDKSEWFTGPQTVNAYYSPSRNEAFIPAGYIQSPLFDPNADPALNYGAIGSIVGHEIGHGFDDQGSKYDGNGVLQSWWTQEDREAFDALGDRLAEQFGKYEPLPGLNVNGRLTLGENIGDLAGVIVAYHAYMLSLEGEEPPVLDGFTGAQRVFLGRAQARRFKQTDESLRRRLLSAPHSPMDLRVNGMVVNIDEWYEAFDVKPGDAMYLPPEERVYIW
ncbi:M13 family metallopeptidase [Hyphococcus flavus]|uniref:M13 family metallopeptidase n=1 Tax=Hyphococcus flavus TaxID=1866326 RepID=A0AAE9ZAR9_9PROT|nr:M13 family metallopeptidase [Hyphococcus flavus]WDI30361.1 M13 family metallopeptidase [Hyphococcus flavus]